MTLDQPGFADPATEAQAGFRAILDAMAYPGRIRRAGNGLNPPAPLAPATAAVLLTLIDTETRLFICPEAAPALDWIIFHCGAASARLHDADFVLAMTLPDLAALQAGNDEEPETGALVILQISSLTDGPPLRLEGPGLAAPTRFCPALPEDFAEIWQRNHQRFPRGVDLILCAGNELAALPRSLSIRRL